MTKYPEFMIDIETLGNRPNAAVVQIGIVAFNPVSGETAKPWSASVEVHPKSEMDVDTVYWWMQQSDEARASVFNGGRINPEDGLRYLNSYIEQYSDAITGFNVWYKPSTFDLVILENLYRNCDMKAPWPHWRTRCLRTLIEVAKLAKEDEAVPVIPHDAGHDAEAQARTAIKCFKKLDNGNAGE